MIVKYARFSADNKKTREFNKKFSKHQDKELAQFPFDVDRLVQAAADELHLKRKPRVLIQGGIPSPHVSGVFFPTLFLPSKWNVSEQVYYMAIKHEIAHIRHKDLIFQRIGLIARIISWFNPLLYVLCSKMVECDELTADATACENVSIANFKAYQHAILDFVVVYPDPVVPVKGFGTAKNKMSLTKERILTMNNKKLNKHKGIKLAATAIVSAVMFTLSAVPALAYTVPPTIETESLKFNPIDTVRLDISPSEDVSDSTLTSTLEAENELYTLLNEIKFAENNWYCVDENGNVSDYDPNAIEPHIIPCNHNYLKAQLSYHTKNSDGSCYVDVYHALKCSKCGHIVETGHFAQTKFDKCPH